MYRLYFCRACENLVIMTYEHMTSPKHDIVVSNYAILLKPSKFVNDAKKYSSHHLFMTCTCKSLLLSVCYYVALY